jgi:SAM-dependent methyltransferase
MMLNLSQQGGEQPMDQFDQFKAMQKQGWAHFAPLEAVTTMPAAQLVKFAGVKPGQRVLDVACGTGVTAITAARQGAKVTALDLTPELLERARYNAQIAGVEIDWHEGDVEKLPFADASFDVVQSQYGHIFAPRPAVAIAEMLRVLKPGGTIAFSTWPPDLFMGRMFTLRDSYMPPPPPQAGSVAIPSPMEWGDKTIIQQRVGGAVRDIAFANGTMLTPVLSPQHHRAMTERTAAPMIKLIETLTVSDPAKLAAFRSAYDALASEYFEDNTMHQDYLMTRATKI